jgi:hypothetical protein
MDIINPDEFLARYLAEIVGNPELIAGDPSFAIGPRTSKTRRDAKLRLRAESGPASDPEVQAARLALQGGVVLPDIR